MFRSVPTHCTINCPVNDSIVLYKINCVYLKMGNSFCLLHGTFRSVGLEIKQPAEIKGSGLGGHN